MLTVTTDPDRRVIEASALWRRLDTPGHDAARLLRTSPGRRLEGGAVFHHESGPARLDYAVTLADDWTALAGEVRGFAGGAEIAVAVERDAGRWRLNGATVDGLDDLVDLDFGFTPATNLPQLRRLDLAIGDAAEFEVAWWDVGETSLTRLVQRYERIGERAYRYRSPSVGYAETLELGPGGFVRVYPELWRLETDGPPG